MKYDIPANMREVTLTNGAVVICRPVPPYATVRIIGTLKQPEYPTVELRSKSGAVERRPALRDTPEHNEWVAAEHAYRNEMIAKIRRANLLIGVVSWKFPGMTEYAKDPPDDWQVPDYLVEVFGKTSQDPSERRLQFIEIELLYDNANDQLITAATGGDTKSLTDKEIADAMRPFGSSESTVLQ